MFKRLILENMATRFLCYIFFGALYAFCVPFAYSAGGAVSSEITQAFLIDFMFNMAGAVFGGIAQLCFSLNNQSTFIKGVAIKALRNIILSIFIGFVIFIATEKGGFFEQESGMKQLFFVTIGGAFASETMEKLREFWHSKFPSSKNTQTGAESASK